VHSADRVSTVRTAPHTAKSPPVALADEFPPFRILHKLGNGGFGCVYKALVEGGPLTGTPVAVKEMASEANVVREVKALCTLPPHDHCVKFLGTRREPNKVYVVMEFVSGGTLRSFRGDRGLSEAILRRYARMTLLALIHMHAHRMVHQDIKGDNVLVNEQGSIKLVDFGCAKVTGHSNMSRSCGTVRWMAPEVLRGAAPSPKSDMWSFGCMLIELTNSSGCPWDLGPSSGNEFVVLHAIANAKKPPAIPPQLTPIFQDFIRQCVQLDPEKRPTAVAHFSHPFLTAPDAPDDESQVTPPGTQSKLQQAALTPEASRSAGFHLYPVDYDDDDDDTGAPVIAEGIVVGRISEGNAQPTLLPPHATVSPLAKLAPNASTPDTTIFCTRGTDFVQPRGATWNMEELDSANKRQPKLVTVSPPQVVSATLTKKPAKKPSFLSNVLEKFSCLAP